jgi:hypothetical protein
MAKITGGSLIRRAGGPNILGTAGCLVQWPGKTDQLLLLTAARVLVGRTAEQFEAIEAVEAVDLPGKPIGCLYAWSDLNGPTTADVALVHVDPALVDAGIGPSGAPKGTNLDPKLGDKLTIFASGKTHNLTITSFGDQTIDRVTPDSRAPVNYLNQIICDPATEDRCVGAMAMDGNNNIVGMVVGGDGTSFTLVTPIDALLSYTFGGPEGPALEVCTSVPGTAKAPEKVTHPDHVSGAQPAAAGPGVGTVGDKAEYVVCLRSAERNGAPASKGEAVDAAVFSPPRVRRRSNFLVQVYLFKPEGAAETVILAREADAQAVRRGTYSLPLDLEPGTRLDIHLEMADLRVREPDAVLYWRGRIVSTQFEVEVPAKTELTNTIGRVRFAVSGIPAGTLRFIIEVVARGETTEPVICEVDAVRYRRAFVSYSSEDRKEVLHRVQAFIITGMSVFQDVLNLDPGQRWEKQLYREIDDCDVFLLFWSRAAAASKWVAKEIDYALSRKEGNDEHPPAIQPVPIDGPPPTPAPDALRHLHFNDALLAAIQAARSEEPS